MINNNRHTMVISFHDFMRFSPDMAQLVFTEYYKYEPTLNEALTTFMLEFDKHHEGHDENQDLKEKFEVAFDKGLTEADHSVRDLKCGLLGQLRSFKGTVTRTSEVRPELISGVFHCKNCGQ